MKTKPNTQYFENSFFKKVYTYNDTNLFASNLDLLATQDR